RLSMADDGLTLSIVAERAETLDLIRRNADQLTRDLRDLGYQQIAFAFGQDRRPPRDRASPDPRPDAEVQNQRVAGREPPAGFAAARRAELPASDRLNILI